ncbi:MAG TPA: aminotransferase class I/II-fold pyridoxal phosphate-dependent enzyme [Burkholderiaceae bacterium]|nr:aminotransferase class I/II-fold pyridoxal phosphate-dependent enzyme [Burkholderiaceae bacterium]
MEPIPFLRPRLVTLDHYRHHIESTEKSRHYTNFGPLNNRFEARVLEEWFGGVGAVTTVANATLGLMLAISQTKRAGKYAVMPSFTFAATPLAAQWCGLEPLFVDVDPDEWVVDQAALKAVLDRYGDDIAVVVPYATAGTHMDLAPYEALQARGIPVVVDAAASMGTMLDGQPFGKGFPGIVVFSFHATKAFPVGEAGMIYSADAQVLKRIRLASNYSFDGGRESTAMGLNAKISELTAAVALATFDRFRETMQIRRDLYQRYLERLEDSGLLTSGFRLHGMRGQALYQWLPLMAPDRATQERVVKVAAEQRIELRRYFAPACHEHRQFRSCPTDALTFTRQLSERVLSLPLWDEMTPAMVDRVVDTVAQAAGVRSVDVRQPAAIDR